jgi:hypothetical protein
VSRKNKKKKRNQNKHNPDRNQQSSEGSDSHMVYTVRIEPHPDQKQRDADESAYRQTQITQARQLNRVSSVGTGIAFLALIGLVVNAVIVHQQLSAARDANGISQTATDRAYRPYIGTDHIQTEALYTGSKAPPKFGSNANNFRFEAVIKNFGPVPGTKYTGRWEVFLDGQKVQGHEIPDTPFTLFPGQTTYLEGSVGTENFKPTMGGVKTLVIQVTVEYDGPTGHDKECQKHQFIPRAHEFAALGACNMPETN